MGDVITMQPRSPAEPRARLQRLLELYRQQDAVSRELVLLLGRERAGIYLGNEAAIVLRGKRDRGEPRQLGLELAGRRAQTDGGAGRRAEARAGQGPVAGQEPCEIHRRRWWRAR